MALNLGRIGFSDDGDTSRFALNWLTLVFRDRKLEKAYAYNDIKKAIPLVRLQVPSNGWVVSNLKSEALLTLQNGPDPLATDGLDNVQNV